MNPILLNNIKMKKLSLYLILLTLYGCPTDIGTISGPSNPDSGECPEEPDVVLDRKNVQEVTLNSQMITESEILKQGQSRGYVFEGKEGQRLKYETNDDICLWIYTPENQLLNSTSLPKTGKYTIQVSVPKGSKTFEIAMGLDVVEASNPTSNSSSNNNSPSSPSEPISESDAVALVRNWQKAKRKIFAPPFDRDLGYEFLTGEAYRKNIGASNGSVAWLSNNNAYYTYRLQEVKKQENFSQTGNTAKIDVVTSEQRTLCLNGRPSRDSNTTFSTSKVRYKLQFDDGQWKIEDYNTVQPISRSANPNISCRIED